MNANKTLHHATQGEIRAISLPQPPTDTDPAPTVVDRGISDARCARSRSAVSLDGRVKHVCLGALFFLRTLAFLAGLGATLRFRTRFRSRLLETKVRRAGRTLPLRRNYDDLSLVYRDHFVLSWWLVLNLELLRMDCIALETPPSHHP